MTSSCSDWTSPCPVPKSNRYYSWLTTYVLTDALCQAYHQSPEVLLLSQSFATLNLDEQQGRFTKGYLREVVLCTNGLPVVYARTSVVNPSPLVKNKILTLGHRPIGVNLLYNNPSVSRSPFSYRSFNELQCTYPSSPGTFHHTHLWARRSIFYWGQTQILITEFFSPTLRSFTPIPTSLSSLSSVSQGFSKPV